MLGRLFVGVEALGRSLKVPAGAGGQFCNVVLPQEPLGQTVLLRVRKCGYGIEI